MKQPPTKNSLFFDRRGIYIFPYYLADISFTGSFKKATGVRLKRVIYKHVRGHFYYYINALEAKQAGQDLLKRFLQDRKFYQTVEKNIFLFSQDLLKFCQSFAPLKLPTLTNKQLANLYHQYTSKVIALRDYGGVPVVIDGFGIPFLTNYTNQTCQDFLKAKKIKANPATLFSVLSSPTKMSEVGQEEIERLELISRLPITVLKTIQDRPIDRSLMVYLKRYHPQEYTFLEAHIKKYGWLTFYYSGPAMDLFYLLKSLKADLAESASPPARLNQFRRHFKTLPGKQKALIKKFRLSQELVYLFRLCSSLIYLKDYRKGIYQKSYVVFEPIIREIARRLDLSAKGVKFMSGSEIERGLLKGVDFKNKVAGRLKYCASVIENGGITIFEGAAAKRFIAQSVVKKRAGIKTDIIKGTVAFRGHVRGAVKIINFKTDIPKMRPGDILVSISTNPDLIVAMRQAAALVTDMGGIISHAAIVARELKTPCIVGTKIASQVLKDGDRVEVDADKGVVKILPI